MLCISIRCHITIYHHNININSSPTLRSLTPRVIDEPAHPSTSAPGIRFSARNPGMGVPNICGAGCRKMGMPIFVVTPDRLVDRMWLSY